ncbi:MAG TPA: adenylate/guanylate cyclase domain-containing protein [Stellaceae bacterium]|nr:adenylate/guanylate cyclase domain-containing protein [Stellaceae bacterium]
MRCPRCNSENPADMKFCGQCAAPLEMVCAGCGANNPPQSRFCGRCAAPLDSPRSPGLAEIPPPPPMLSQPAGRALGAGEIKQVTVLFCDIAGSTALTERLGAEAMRELVSRFLEIAIGEIERYGGTVPQFTGDGFMALFGAPRTLEDHVRRALLAALGIRRALGGASGDGNGGRGAGLDLPTHIGIHTGPVVFGPIGGNFAMATAIGDTANFAAHLQDAAGPGTILLSEAVCSAAQHYVRVEPAGPLAIKGRAEPIRAYRLLGLSRSRSTRDGVMPEQATGFVDRTGEVAMLRRRLEDAARGCGGAVGIVGEPGIGKSRIIDEVRRGFPAGRVTWVEGRCASYGMAIPYQLALDVLRSNCGVVESDTPEEIGEKIGAGLHEVGMDPGAERPFLLHALGIKAIEDPSLLSQPEAVKKRTFEIFRQLAVRGSERRPLVLVLEDLHWIDTLSHEFVGYLAESVPGCGILILATHRPEYRPPWIGKPYASEVALSPLSPGDSRDVVRSVLRNDTLADPVTEEIVARADGNPLFLEQLALHAGEMQTRRSQPTVPATIHDVVMARIDRLPEEAKRLLQTAAVIGREFSLRLLRAVWPQRSGLEPLLRELCRLEFVEEWPDDEETSYVFRHALTQETAYASLLARQRQVFHAAIGHALETLYAGRGDEVTELLALHFGRSDNAEKAVDYAIAAAEKAQRRWANSEALGYFSDALGRLEALPDTAPNRLRRIDAVLKQAEVKYALGQYTEHIQALDGIRDIIDRIDDPARRAAWHYWTGFLHSTSGGRPEAAIQHCREAARIASASGLDELDAFAQSCLSQVYMIAGRPRDGLAAGERALASFESRGNRWWAGRTLWHLSSNANYLGEWERSLDYCRRGLEHGLALDDLRLKAAGWSRIGLAYIQRGEVARGLECCEAAFALSPIPRDAAFARAIRGFGNIKTGRLDDGVAELSDALAWFDNARMRWTFVICAVWLAEGWLRQGDRRSARRLIDRVLATSRATGYLQYEGRACWLMAECLAVEAPASAADHAGTATRIFEQIGARNDLARAMVTRAALYQKAGDAATARRLLEGAYGIFSVLGTRDEPERVKTALDAIDRGTAIGLLAGGR